MADPRRIAGILRRQGVLLVLAALAIAAVAAIAILGARDCRNATDTAVATVADRARATLDGEQRNLAELARIAATRPDATVRQLLDQLPALTPGLRGAAIADPAGTVQLRSTKAPDETVLAALADDVAKEAGARPDAPLLITRSRQDNNIALVALARPWKNTDNQLAGIAIVVVDRSAFVGLDLVRADGSALFGDTDTTGAQRVALGDFGLALAVPAGEAPGMREGMPFAVLAFIALGAMLGALAILGARLRAAVRARAGQAIAVRELRAKLEQAANAADRSEELSRTKSQFFAQVTHELRTPLNAILGFSETIRQEMFGPLANPRYLEYAGLIHDAGAHLLSLINDLLDEARIEAGRMEIAPIRVSAPALARSALDLVELLAEGREITVATVGTASCPDLNVDPRAMKQVLVNLLSNAIKYTPPGGRIEMRWAERNDGGATIEIADTGIGMSAADLRAAFEPFGRVGGVEARRQQGTGLGLSLARALVRLHSGDLTLASRPDMGTTATVTLPANAVFAAPSAPAKTPASETAAKAA